MILSDVELLSCSVLKGLPLHMGSIDPDQKKTNALHQCQATAIMDNQKITIGLLHFLTVFYQSATVYTEIYFLGGQCRFIY